LGANFFILSLNMTCHTIYIYIYNITTGRCKCTYSHRWLDYEPLAMTPLLTEIFLCSLACSVAFYEPCLLFVQNFYSKIWNLSTTRSSESCGHHWYWISAQRASVYKKLRCRLPQSQVNSSRAL
jgi:hypothetical protein